MKKAQELLETPEYKEVLNYFRKVRFENTDVYANWLAQTYYFVSHSVRLSSLGASKLNVHDPLSRRMVAHTTEEMGHHTIAENDIKALGRELKDYPCFGITNAFYQSQYYKVLFEHPAHLLGQIIMLEALSVAEGPALYEKVRKAHSEAASKFVKVHAQEDVDHVEKALASVDKLSDEIKEGIKENFLQACEIYLLILRSLNENIQQQREHFAS